MNSEKPCGKPQDRTGRRPSFSKLSNLNLPATRLHVQLATLKALFEFLLVGFQLIPHSSDSSKINPTWHDIHPGSVAELPSHWLSAACWSHPLTDLVFSSARGLLR